MKASVLVTSYNNADELVQCLRAIKASENASFSLIVVDDGSQDAKVAETAREFADQVYRHPDNLGRSQARTTAMRNADEDILIFIDSDVVVRKDSISQIINYLETHPETDAVTGLLAKEHPNTDFFSQYKNLYMHYRFRNLPRRANFLYGSIHAIRKSPALSYVSDVQNADDTAMGLRLHREGKRIDFLRSLEVIHLKHYTFKTFFINDFVIPFDWGKLFIHRKGWRELGSNTTGFLHASKAQLAGLLFAVLTASALLIPAASPFLPFTLWCCLNISFWKFLYAEKGVSFLLKSIPVTFADQLTMASGSGAGIISALMQKYNGHLNRNTKNT